MLAAFGEQLSIIDVKWFPGSKTIVAVCTQIFIRIYDLSNDNFTPVYNIQSTGSISDFTFTTPITNDSGLLTTRILVVSNEGDLYSQELAINEAYDKSNQMQIDQSKSDITVTHKIELP
jgi:hypothetical protein